jgi:hypothetical protein
VGRPKKVHLSLTKRQAEALWAAAMEGEGDMDARGDEDREEDDHEGLQDALKIFALALNKAGE